VFSPKHLAKCKKHIQNSTRIYRVTRGEEHKEVKLLEEWLAGSMDKKMGQTDQNLEHGMKPITRIGESGTTTTIMLPKASLATSLVLLLRSDTVHTDHRAASFY